MERLATSLLIAERAALTADYTELVMTRQGTIVPAYRASPAAGKTVVRARLNFVCLTSARLKAGLFEVGLLKVRLLELYRKAQLPPRQSGRAK